MENSTVINLCGNYPENFEKADVLSDPNYVFKNDSSYQGYMTMNLTQFL